MRKLIFVSIATVLAIGIGLGAYFALFTTKQPIPSRLAKQFSFGIYYPKQLPGGWHIDRKSFNNNSNQALIYKITNGSQNVSVSVQAQPEAFDFQKFYTATLSKSTQFTTSLGQAAIGKGQYGYTIGSITTGDSWVLVTSNSADISQDTIRAVLNSLTKAS